MFTADRVKETTTSTGTGTINLSGAVTGFQTFVAGVGTGQQCYYAIVGPTGEWEIGKGTVTDASPDTLSRTTVYASSNAGSLVNFSAGTKDVFITMPSTMLISGPAASVTDETLAIWNGTSGQLLKSRSAVKSDSNSKLIAKAFRGDLVTLTDGATITLDFTQGHKFQTTLGGNRTLAISGVTNPDCFFLLLKQDGTGSRTVTWWSGIKWPGGSAPTLTTTASKADWFGFLYDGSNYWATIFGQNL